MEKNYRYLFGPVPSRRPCTADQIADVFDMHLNKVSKYLGKLIRTGQIRSELKKRAVYYLAVNRKEKACTSA